MVDFLYYLREEESFAEKVGKIITDNPGAVIKGVAAVCILPSIINFVPYAFIGYELYVNWDTIQTMINNAPTNIL